MTTQWLPEQGRRGLEDQRPTSDERLVPDVDCVRELVLLVYAPIPDIPLRWSISWEVGRGAWRHISVDFYPGPSPHYVFWSAQTKRASLDTVHAEHISLGAFDLATRRRIETISWDVPVAAFNGRWDSRHWILDLLNRICAAKIISPGTWARVVAAGSHGTPALLYCLLSSTFDPLMTVASGASTRRRRTPAKLRS